MRSDGEERCHSDKIHNQARTHARMHALGNKPAQALAQTHTRACVPQSDSPTPLSNPEDGFSVWGRIWVGGCLDGLCSALPAKPIYRAYVHVGVRETRTPTAPPCGLCSTCKGVIGTAPHVVGCRSCKAALRTPLSYPAPSLAWAARAVRAARVVRAARAAPAALAA